RDVQVLRRAQSPVHRRRGQARSGGVSAARPRGGGGGGRHRGLDPALAFQRPAKETKDHRDKRDSKDNKDFPSPRLSVLAVLAVFFVLGSFSGGSAYGWESTHPAARGAPEAFSRESILGRF